LLIKGQHVTVVLSLSKLNKGPTNGFRGVNLTKLEAVYVRAPKKGKKNGIVCSSLQQICTVETIKRIESEGKNMHVTFISLDSRLHGLNYIFQQGQSHKIVQGFSISF